jgi:predicted DNA-binding transcriptional regulator AlpA
MTAGETLLSRNDVMARYGYTSRSSFWQFVQARGVPHISLSPRKIMFGPAALEAWEAKRSNWKPK